MWLKLANATFSVNLGQMSVLSNSISIKYNGLNGAFAINKSSVSKDDTSAELKLTLNSGWTCTSASATVTGASETSDSYSNGVLTINIKPSSGTTFGDSDATEIVINVTHDATGASSGGSGGNEPETPVNPPSDSDISALVSAYSTSMTSAQQSALKTYINTIKSNSTLASKIKKMYMPILSTTLDDVRINVADYINNNTATVDTFSGTWNDTTYSLKNNGIYNITSSTNVYTTTGIAGMSTMKMNNLGLISVSNITAGSTNGTRLTSTGGGCFFLRNYSAGNAAVQGTHSGQTGTYCGKDLNVLYGVSAGYFQNKTTNPCIDMMMFSETQFLGLENATGDVKTYNLASEHADVINVNMQDICYFSYLIPTTKANTDYGTVEYMIMITEALTTNEMIALRDAVNTFVDTYLA